MNFHDGLFILKSGKTSAAETIRIFLELHDNVKASLEMKAFFSQ